MPVRNTTRHSPIIWIPPTTTAIYKITITRSNGTVDDLSEVAHSIEVEDGVTDNIGRFELELYNPNETYTNVWTGMETFLYYKDYATTATTLRFRGKVEKVSYQNNKVKLVGRAEAFRIMSINVNKSTTAVCSQILQEIFETYLSGVFTYTGISTDTTEITVNWYQKPMFDCIQELCTASGYDFYIDKDMIVNFFLAGSRQNTTDAIVHDFNLIEIDDFSEDISQVRNKVQVYGGTVKGIQTIYTAQDTASQAKYGIRETIISDDSITSYAQAKDVADYYLTKYKNPPIIGGAKAISLLATIQPGEKIKLSSPADNMPPGYYQSISYKDVIDLASGELSTTVKLSKESRRTTHIFRDLITNAAKKTSTTINPYGMDYSFDYTFAEDSGTHTTTTITNGVLKPTGASGTWLSPTRALDNNLNQASLVMSGETLTGAAVYVSGDGGLHYLLVPNYSLVNASTVSGKTLMVKVVFNNADTQIDALSLQYNTSSS